MKRLQILGMCALFSGCAHLDPGADPLIVRAEQTEAIADSTMYTFLHLEDENHAIVKLKAPAISAFAEKLRAPTPHGGTNVPYASALIYSLSDVKHAYKSDRSNSNLLVVAITTGEATLFEIAKYIPAINALTNSIPK